MLPRQLRPTRTFDGIISAGNTYTLAVEGPLDQRMLAAICAAYATTGASLRGFVNGHKPAVRVDAGNADAASAPLRSLGILSED